MKDSDSNSICEQARLYYYDYLDGNGKEHIPAEISAHISQCHLCQSEINRLKIVLAGAEESVAESGGQTTSITTANLGLHFAHTGIFVTCKTIRPFLPGLADPALEVSIPTPITVHLDKCQQCANDLETIRQLNLTHKQLCRLGQLFAEKPAEGVISCSQARAAVLAVVTMVFSETNADVHKHLCTCPDCRKLLYNHRKTVREELLLHNQGPIHEFPCEAVSASDIFDYCVPYGIDPANDQYAKFRPAFTTHVVGCTTCLGKMQDLHKTIHGILEREESGIVTCFKACNLTHETSVGDFDNEYDDWPIEVSVFDTSSETESVKTPDLSITKDATVSYKLPKKLSFPDVRRFIKPAIVAAAVLLFAILWLNVSVAKAVDLRQIYGAIEQIRNIYITMFAMEKSKPTQEIWISRALNIKLFKADTQWIMWDLKGKLKKVRDLNTSSTTVTGPSEDALAEVEETVEGAVGLMPFDNISGVPEDAKWQQVTDETIETTITNTKVYDLTWTEKRLSGKIVYRRWRGYVDIETKLPKRVEQWEKSTNEEYQLLDVMEVAYPTITEIQTVISNAGF